MKRIIFIILSGLGFFESAVAQNTLDLTGLTASTPSAASYSLRQLSSSYTGFAIQVRRSSDNSHMNIGFVSGNLDTTSLKTFAGTGSAYIRTWYDQSGSGRNAVQASASLQPGIVLSGVIYRQKNLPTVYFNGSKLATAAFANGYPNAFTLVVCAGVKTNTTYSTFGNKTKWNLPAPWDIYNSAVLISNGSGASQFALNKAITSAAGFSQWVFQADAISGAAYVNGAANGSGPTGLCSDASPATAIVLGSRTDGATTLNGWISEFITFPVVLASADRQVLETNQSVYFNMAAPVITAQPSLSGQNLCISGTATALAVSATGTGTLTYQWYSNTVNSNTGGTLISGATNSTYTPPTASAGTLYYYVMVADGGFAATSNVSGAITVDAAPVVTITPAAATIHTGESVNLVASGASSYTWGADNATPLDHVSGYRMAVGLRRLRSSYTGAAIRLRRDSDNAEADFSFISSELDMAAINSFLGTNNGYCKILYDQAGFGNDMTQNNPSEQPLFVAAGLNGKPVLRFNTSQLMNNPTYFPPPFSVIYCAKQTGPSRQRVLTCNNNWLLGWWGGDKAKAHFDGWVTASGGSPADSNPYVYSGTGTGALSSVYENGVLLASNAGGVTGPNGPSFNGNERSDFEVTELFIFNNVLSDLDREAVENSTGSYYAVFGMPPVFGSNLLVSPTVTSTYNVIGLSANGGCAVQQSVVVTVLNNPGLSNFPAQEKLYYDSAYTMPAPVSSSNGAFTYSSSNSAVAIINGSQVIITGTGVTTITAVQAADGGYFTDSISTTLTVTSVSVVSANGGISSSNYQYVNKYGQLAGTRGVNANGASLITKSGGNGLTPATASSSAYQIKQDYPSSLDGLYWIKNPAINGGAPFRIYADMTTDGGGWTLILCSKSPNPGWTNAEALLRNQNSPSINSTYSIIGWADYIKKSSSGFQYMMDAQTRGAYGGIWTVNSNYSFVSTSNANTNITLNIKFGTWNYSGSDIEPRMPWYSPGSQGLVTTSADANNDWWGTLVASGGWNPAPWLGSSMQGPGVIWYWVR